MDEDKREKSEMLRKLEYSMEISNPLGGSFWDNLEQPLSGGYNEFYEYRKWFNSKN